MCDDVHCFVSDVILTLNVFLLQERGEVLILTGLVTTTPPPTVTLSHSTLTCVRLKLRSLVPSTNYGVGGAGSGTTMIVASNEAGHRETVPKRLCAGVGGGAC